MGKGSDTRERILEIAEASVLAKGFAATSIDEIIAEAGLTKSGFFYHFRDKNELARDMLRRYVAEDNRILDEIFARAADLSDDPLQIFLIGLKLLAETLSDLPNGHPGCMIASVCYQERLFDREVIEINRQAIEGLNRRFRGYLDDVAAVYAQREPVDLDVLAELVPSIIDGGIIMAKATSDPQRLPRQILAFRSLVKLLYSEPVAATAQPPARERPSAFAAE
ncbi:MAG: TetR/AcrR family transcriptional regulator [Mesorhizobium sp.]